MSIETVPFFKSKFPIGIYVIAIIFITVSSFFIYKGMSLIWALFYASAILIVGLSFYRNHYTIRLFDNFFEVSFFNPLKKKRKIYYNAITGIETENGVFLKYEYLTGNFIATEDKLIINYQDDGQNKNLYLKVVSEIKLNKTLKKLAEKTNHLSTK